MVVAFNHVTGRRRDQSAPEQETSGSAAERGQPRLAAIARTQCPSTRRRLGPIEWRKVCQGRREVVTIGNCPLRELPPSPTHFGDQMHEVKTTVDEENFKGIPRDFSTF